jgi:hypothetical protein
MTTMDEGITSTRIRHESGHERRRTQTKFHCCMIPSMNLRYPILVMSCLLLMNGQGECKHFARSIPSGIYFAKYGGPLELTKR